MHYHIEELFYQDNKIKTQIPQPIKKSTYKTAIVIHLFYSDVWEELYAYLHTLIPHYDLYVTLGENSTDDDALKIFQTMPQTRVYRVENRGRDVLPFLQVIHLFEEMLYTSICKLHTKKTAGSPLGQVWRKLLYFDLIGSQEIVDVNTHMFTEDHTIGIVTGKNTILDSQKYAYGNSQNVQTLTEQAGLTYHPYYHFPAGTMFWIRASLLSPLLKLFKEDMLIFEKESGQTENTLAHAIERFFGILCESTDHTIIPSTAPYQKLSEETLHEVSSLVLSQQYAGLDMFTKQKNVIQDKDNYIHYLEELTESMRIKNRIRHMGTSILLPLGKKVAKVPKKVIQIAKVTKNNPQLLKKVWHYARRGELKYLLTKIRQKSANNLSQTDTLIEISYEDYFRSWDESKYTLPQTPIDIIIPVYNGYEFLAPLFNSVEAHTPKGSYRLIVINDCSPDENVKPYLLQRLEKHPNSIFIDHTENQGFLKSVNEAYTHTEGHFVLLNTDTEVPSFWLERLMYPILHQENIASTTPFTNAGEIASFPEFIADNLIFDGLSVEALDNSFKEVNSENFTTPVPTGVGFCMGVNGDVAKELGMFVEDTFGKGYGEENDWCQRAIKAGYTNLIVPNLFVYHKHGGSFSAEEKQKLLQKNIVTLNQRHPNYGADVTDYIEQNPHRTLRELLVLKASNTHTPLTLIFDHHLGGGANIYRDEYIQKQLDADKNTLLIKYDFYSHCYILSHHYKAYNHSFKMSTFEALKDFLDALDIDTVFLNNLVSYPESHTLLNAMYDLCNTTKAKLILPFHDAYMICPSYNLLNEKGVYCEVPDLETCKTCMQRNTQEWRNFYHEEVDIPAWREAWQKLINISTEIVCFSHNSKEIFLRAYPDTTVEKISILPHQVPPLPAVKVEKHSQNDTITIGILGAINYVKGAQIIKQMVQIIERDRLDIRIVVIGEITETIKSKHFHVTGRYERDNLPKIIQKHQINTFLIPSIWPETFSYTTQEIMMMEMPLMVFDLGAPAERVKNYNKGYIIDTISANAILDTLHKEDIS